MKKLTFTFATLILLLCCLAARPQNDTLYYSGFDTYAQQWAWMQFHMGDDGPYVHWAIDSSGYSLPNCLFHDYIDNSTIEDWYVSPHIINGSISFLSLKTMVFCFNGTAAPGDHFGVWFSPTTVNPASGTFIELADLTPMSNAGNPWLDTIITGFPASGGWIALNFKNATDWFTVRVDNFLVSGTLSSIAEKDPAEKITLYPNPTRGCLTIKGLTNKTTAEVYDISGKLLLTQPVSTGQMDLCALTKGLYFIKLSTAEGSVVKKFVKE